MKAWTLAAQAGYAPRYKESSRRADHPSRFQGRRVPLTKQTKSMRKDGMDMAQNTRRSTITYVKRSKGSGGDSNRGGRTKTYRDVMGKGYTSYHDDGSVTKTYKNVMGEGYTSYHDDGGVTKTYKDVMGEGYTSYYDDGSVTKTYKNVMGEGYTSYHMPADHSFDFIYVIFAVSFIFLSIVSLISLGKHAIVSLALLAISVAARAILINKRETPGVFLWLYPFTLLGWRLLVNAMWNHTNGNYLEPFGVFFITLGIVASLFIDCHAFGWFFYGFLTLIVMVVAKAYGQYVPYYIVSIMLSVALLWTVIHHIAGKGAERRRNR